MYSSGDSEDNLAGRFRSVNGDPVGDDQDSDEYEYGRNHRDTNSMIERRRRGKAVQHEGQGEQHDDVDFDPYESAYIFTLEEAQDIVQTFDRMKNDLMFLKAKFQTDVVIRRPKKDPLLKAWLTDNLLLISFIWQ